MRLGRVQISHSYVVDLDNKEMVEDGTEALYDDLMNAVKFDELGANIVVLEAPDASESDIPDFLLTGNPEDEEDDE